MRVIFPNFCWVLGPGVFACTLFLSCLGAAEEHACDLSKQLDFRVVGDIEGEWRTESGYSPFKINEQGHIHGELFGCAHRKYSVVVGDYNTFDGGIGNGKRWLVSAELRSGSFELRYKEGKGEGFSVTVASGKIIAPGVLIYNFLGVPSDTLLYRRRPGDEEQTGTTMTGTSEGTDVSSTGTTADPEETMTTNTGTEADSGTEGSGL